MSVKYVTVQWTKRKIAIDIALLIGVGVYIGLFKALAPIARPDVSAPILEMRAWGSCAFLLITLILCIGPLARLNTRFNPLLYNRRHFGVLMFFVTLMHAKAVLDFYYAYSDIPKLIALLSFDMSFTSATVPFILFGVIALVIFFFMAVSSHDFWQKTLGASTWKSLHMGVYAAYALVVLHVAFGMLQFEDHPVLVSMVGASVLVVGGLHILAALRSSAGDGTVAATERLEDGEWIAAGPARDIPLDRALPVTPPTGERIAVIRYQKDGKEYVNALSGVCAHQGGPLYEGKVIDGCLTCPWHGWQYRPGDGCSPPPFEERLPTYRIRLKDGDVLIDPRPLPAGTEVEPVEVKASESSNA